MEKVETLIEVKHFIECPHCGFSKSRIDHLFTKENKSINFGPWYCDECGKAYKGEVVGRDVFVEKIKDKRKDKCIVFLKNSNVLIAVKSYYYNGKIENENFMNFYNEHTCPTNYLGVEMVVDLNKNEIDPHGIFEFVSAVKWFDTESEEDIFKKLPI